MDSQVDSQQLIRFFRIAQIIVEILERRVSVTKGGLVRDVARRVDQTETTEIDGLEIRREIRAAIEVLHDGGVLERRGKPAKYLLKTTQEPLALMFPQTASIWAEAFQQSSRDLDISKIIDRARPSIRAMGEPSRADLERIIMREGIPVLKTFSEKLATTPLGVVSLEYSPIIKRAASPPSDSVTSEKSVPQPAPVGYVEQPVLYSVCRNRDDTAHYGTRRLEGAKPAFGRATVTIPLTHKMGKIERPSWLKFQFKEDANRDITLRAVEELTLQAFQDETREKAGAKAQAMIFVHGYNMSFDDALRRTGQLAYDLEFTGAAIAFAWPTAEAILGYFRDANDVAWSAPRFQALLAALEIAGITDIYIIAHSMGNRLVLQVLKQLADAKQLTSSTTLIMAAADVDRAVFEEQIWPNLSGAIGSATLYASSSDSALKLSRAVQGNYERLGDANEITVVDGMTTVDATLVNTDFLARGDWVNHSYFASVRALISDMYYAMRGITPPRHGLRTLLAKGKRYWQLVP